MDIFIIITLGALLVAAGMAWYVRRSGKLEPVQHATPFLEDLDWDDYLLLIREHYVRQGFVLRENPTGGADFEIERDGHRQLVNFVDWRDGQAGEQAVREFHAMVAARKLTGGILISAGRFTSQAWQLAMSRRIDLIDGPRLRQLVEAARNEDGELTAPRVASDNESTTPRRVVLCPVCGRAMVRRFERRDGESRPYYGCVRAPDCSGRRNLA